MVDLIVIAAFAAGLFTSWTIGANGAATAFGPVNSAKAVNVLQGSLVVGFAALVGAVTQGDRVAGTMQNGLIKGIEFTPQVATIILVIASSLILFSILTQYPMPTVFTVVGGVLGAGIATGGAPNVAQLKVIGAFWLVIPFVAVGIGYGTATLLRTYVPKTPRNKRYIGTVLFVLAAYTAYTAGANQVGLAVGPLRNVADAPLTYFLAFGGLGMMVGAWTGSPKIIEAVGRDYSKMGPRRAISALLAASVLAQAATLYGVPVSFNEAVISAVIGSGLAGGDGGVGGKKIALTIAGWIGAFIVSFTLTYVVTYLLV